MGNNCHCEKQVARQNPAIVPRVSPQQTKEIMLQSQIPPPMRSEFTERIIFESCFEDQDQLLRNCLSSLFLQPVADQKVWGFDHHDGSILRKAVVDNHTDACNQVYTSEFNSLIPATQQHWPNDASQNFTLGPQAPIPQTVSTALPQIQRQVYIVNPVHAPYFQPGPTSSHLLANPKQSQQKKPQNNPGSDPTTSRSHQENGVHAVQENLYLKTEDWSLYTVKLILEHENNALALLGKINTRNKEIYNKALELKTPQNQPWITILMYVTAWTSFKLCRSVEILRSRSDPSNLYFYSLWPLAEYLTNICRSYYQLASQTYPKLCNEWQAFSESDKSCRVNLQEFADLVGRNESTSEEKTHLMQLVKDTPFRPAAVRITRTSAYLKDMVYQLLGFHDSFGSTLTPGVKDWMKESIALNYLLLLIEQSPPITMIQNEMGELMPHSMNWSMFDGNLTSICNIDELLDASREELQLELHEDPKQ